MRLKVLSSCSVLQCVTDQVEQVCVQQELFSSQAVDNDTVEQRHQLTGGKKIQFLISIFIQIRKKAINDMDTWP